MLTELKQNTWLAGMGTQQGWLVGGTRKDIAFTSLHVFFFRWGCRQAKGELSRFRDSFDICLLESGRVERVVDDQVSNLCPSSTWCIVQDSAGPSLGTAAGKEQHALPP